MSADWTPLRPTRKVNADGDTAIASKFFAGILITSGAAATTVLVRDGTSGTDPIKFTFKVETANTTRMFPAPGFLMMQTGIFVDIDASTLEWTALHG